MTTTEELTHYVGYEKHERSCLKGKFRQSTTSHHLVARAYWAVTAAVWAPVIDLVLRVVGGDHP